MRQAAAYAKKIKGVENVRPPAQTSTQWDFEAPNEQGEYVYVAVNIYEVDKHTVTFTYMLDTSNVHKGHKSNSQWTLLKLPTLVTPQGLVSELITKYW